jgi:hypothetical protein
VKTNGRFRETTTVGQQETQLSPGISVFGIHFGGANVTFFGVDPITGNAEAVSLLYQF